MALASVLLLGAARADWLHIHPAGDSFAISVPAMPEKKEVFLETPLGQVRSVIYSVGYGSSHYAVVYAEYPTAFVEKVPVEVLFDAQLARLVPPHRSKIESQKAVDVSGFRGREIVFTSEDGAQVSVAHLAMIRERLYSVVGSTRRNGLPQDEIRRFVDSFKAS